ncbi:MAG: indole-3-glycerol phosphate synthase TrpC [Chitinophagaceae bacterium]
MSILDEILNDKRKEVKQKKKFIPEKFLRNREIFLEECASLKYSLLEENATGIIAEFKRKSPSRGWINKDIDVMDVILDYEIYGASGVSILTDEIYFGGLVDDLIDGRLLTDLPILRKDFIIDEYQIIETKSWGADVILLIAACLTVKQVKQFSLKAHQIGLEVLLEIHNEFELGHICDSIDMVGVNNRNLKTFEINIETSFKLAEKIPEQFVKISESGISDVAAIHLLKQNGFKGFLIGEAFMQTQNPGEALGAFADEILKK